MQGVNYLYNSPWYDFQRGFIKVGEVMSGNYYWGSSPYMTLTVNSTDADLTSMSNSLWSVIGHANTVYNNLKGASASQAVKNQCMGECLAWKAMAYFFLVRSFGDVPIIHDNSAMLAGDFYDYFWIDKTDRQGRKGFNFLQFLYASNGYGSGGPGTLQSATGANCVKHLYGDAYDHKTYAVDGISASNMHSSLATPVLRLSDVYLVYAEAVIGNNGSTTDASAIDAYYKVRSRAVRSAARPASITWEDVWKERRLELAMEGDRWYDFVRRSYYDMAGSIRELKQQKRGAYYGLNTLYKNYYESKAWNVDPSTMHYATETQAPNVSEQSFTLPFPSQDIVFNGNLQKGSVHVDVRSTYAY